MRKIVLGTRGSVLALKQVDIVVQAFQAAHPDTPVETRVIVPQGDRDKTSPIPLDQIGKGWFSQEIEEELSNGTIDIAVHSLKDLQQELPKGLVIAAYLPREDARDALLTKHGEPLEALKPGAIVGTDSSRRQVQMLALKPDAVMKSLRGNVPNRVEKLKNEEYDAIILAAAGLIRLGMQERITKYFEPHEMTPAPGQGVIAVQTRESDTELRELLKAINDADATRAFEIERAFSSVVGGGCKAPTGAYAWREGNTWHLIGMVEDGRGGIIREKVSSTDADTRLGEDLAHKLLDQRSHGTNA